MKRPHSGHTGLALKTPPADITWVYAGWAAPDFALEIIPGWAGRPTCDHADTTHVSTSFRGHTP